MTRDDAYRRAQDAARLLGEYRGGCAPIDVLERVHGLLAGAPPGAMSSALATLGASTPRASSANDPTVDIELTGKVGADFAAGGRSFSFLQVAKQLRSADPVAHVRVTISSSGGGAEEGLEIYHLLRSHKGLLTTVAKDRCQSAAGTIFLAGAHRKAYAGTQFLIHSVAFNGGYALQGRVDAATLASEAAELQRQTDQILNIYAERATAPIARFREMCRAGRDFDADAARRLGIVHRVIPAPPQRGPARNR